MEEETVDDKEQDNDADAKEDDYAVNLSDDEIEAQVGGKEPPLTRAHFTSPDVDVDILIRRRNVMTP